MSKINTKTIIKVLFTIILTIFLYATNVNAADYTCNIETIKDKTNIKPGESITYQIKATNINAGQGITMFQTTLVFDSNKFEYKVAGDDSGKWSIMVNTNNELVMNVADPSTANAIDQVIAKITFTAKSSVLAGTYQAKLSNIKFTVKNEDKTFTI